MKKKILTVLIFVWGVALRGIEVLTGNYLFGFDIGRDMLVARSLVETHKWTLIGAQIGSGSAGIDGIFQGPGYYYLLAVPYLLFHGDPYGTMLMMFLFGVVTLVAAYWTMQHMFDEWTAIVALYLVAISPLLVSQSRFMWAPHPASLLIVLSLFFTYMISRHPRLFGPLAVLATGLIYHFEFAMTIPMMIALFLAMPFIYRIKDVKTYVYSAATAIFVFIPFIVFEARHGFMAVKSIFAYTAPQQSIGIDVWVTRALDHFPPYVANARNSFVIERGLLPESAFTILVAVLFAALIFCAWKVKNMTQRMFFRFLLLLLVVSYGVLLFLNNSVWDYYLVHAHFIFIYLFAYCFIYSCRSMQKSLWSKIAFVFLAIYLVSMSVASVWRMMISYRYDYHDIGGVEKIIGKKAAVDYVYADAEGKPFSEFTFMAPIYTYPYDYLFQTYGKKKYGYIPGTVKKGLVYLIIEPDSSKPWTYKGWLETVIVGGDILKTVTLPTGQIVQVRQFP